MSTGGRGIKLFYCPTCLVSADWCGAFHKHQLFHASKSLAHSQLCVCSLVSSNHIHVDAAIITSYFTRVKAVFCRSFLRRHISIWSDRFLWELWIFFLWKMNSETKMAQLVAQTNATGAKNKPSFARSLQSSSKPELIASLNQPLSAPTRTRQTWTCFLNGATGLYI